MSKFLLWGLICSFIHFHPFLEGPLYKGAGAGSTDKGECVASCPQYTQYNGETDV